ncbi:MarR family transcriptional regulator [Luteimicrobium album]|uniref:MarR family transcriptional regulator n=1 Tax=Luteimicrobium album TaxID=1054550 RepID=A0ABQ6HXW5_9MICO|nr:MarR family transcriptional regulator [Luteimicrobium album]GMA22861.1 MarR family transcriptional regulator [Luteimicrobium album]
MAGVQESRTVGTGPALADDGGPIGVIDVQLAVTARNTELLRRRAREPGELDRAAYLILRALGRLSSADINELATVLGLDASTVGRQVAALADQGLVRREPAPDDRRRSVVSATADGRDRAALTSALRQGRTRELLAGWDDESLAEFAGLLARYNAAVAAHYMTGLHLDSTGPDEAD